MDLMVASGNPHSGRHIAIVGAGMVGVSTAVWLQRSGHRVTLIDREGPAAGTSYGNAGVLAAASVVPVTVPGLLRKAPGMLLDRNSPLFLRWSYLPKLIPFLAKYLPHGNVDDVNRIADGLTLLLEDTAEQHVALAAGTGAEKYVVPGDYLFGYKNRDAFEADAFAWAVRRDRGFEFHVMDQAEFDAYDPAMSGRFGVGVRCPNHGRITDPGAYVKALAAHVVDAGGTVLESSVTDIVRHGNLISVETNNGVVEADDVVVATGIWSGPLARKFGVNVPMETERGYHIEFVNPSITPKSPVMVATGKFVMTPMDGRLRCAGIVEFGGLHNSPSQAPFDLLKRQTLSLLPELKYDSIEEWMGHRPSTTDSMPVIGQSPVEPNVWMGFGHQHVGLSGGPKTGRWLAQLIGGHIPNTDLAHFAPTRFSAAGQKEFLSTN